MIQGTTLALVAKWLQLTLPENLKPRKQTDIELNDVIKSILKEIIIPENCSVIGKQIVQLGMPKNTWISFIQRGNKYITPTGSTILLRNDKLYVLSENEESLEKVFECLGVNKNNA